MPDSTDILLCPECKAMHDLEIPMRELIYVKQYHVTPDMITGSDKYLKLYQCPSCKSVYTEEVDVDTEIWRAKYKALLEEYRISHKDDDVEETEENDDQ